MLRSSALFQAVALPYELLTRHPVWRRHCARMALELPKGARLVLDLGCGPGNSTVQLPIGTVGADCSLPMLRRARRRKPGMPLVCLQAAALPARSGSLDAVTFHSVLYLLPDQPAALRETARVRRTGEPHGAAGRAAGHGARTRSRAADAALGSHGGGVADDERLVRPLQRAVALDRPGVRRAAGDPHRRDAGRTGPARGSGEAVRILHFSDPHVQLPRWRERPLRELGPLRAVATVELWKGRGRDYDDALLTLRQIVRDAEA